MSAPLEILHRDEHVLVVSKPAGVLSTAAPRDEGRTLIDALAEAGLAATPVHRLDRDVSGAIVCAFDPSTRTALEEQFRERSLRKIYWALSLMGPKKDVGELKYPIAEERGMARVSAMGKPALTRYRVLVRGLRANEVEIDLVTGRYNQIRLHFAHSGWPLVGERKYGRGKEDPFRYPRVALHAWKVEFAHPRTKQPLAIEAPLPPELVELREQALMR
jgi:RluA family pseudouridine synthase